MALPWVFQVCLVLVSRQRSSFIQETDPHFYSLLSQFLLQVMLKPLIKNLRVHHGRLCPSIMYLLSVFYVANTIPDAGDAAVNNAGSSDSCDVKQTQWKKM